MSHGVWRDSNDKESFNARVKWCDLYLVFRDRVKKIVKLVYLIKKINGDDPRDVLRKNRVVCQGLAG